MNEELTMNKMGTEPVPKILLTMGIPIILSMVLQACYNIVDSMFVARIPDSGGIEHLGEYCVNALTLAFPVQMLIIAFGIGTGVGVNALLARSLGMGDKEKAAWAAGNGIMMGIIIYIVFLLFGLFAVPFYLKTQTNNAIILELGVSYLRICAILSAGNILYAIYEKLLQATGKTVYSTIAQVSGAMINIIFDPIFIFGWFGVPAMGINGAAWATVFGQFVSMAVAMFFHYRKNSEIKNGLHYLRLQKCSIMDIYAVGLPAIIMQALMSFMTYGINIIFGAVSVGAVTAYGIFYKIQQFLFFAGFGLRDAITPLISFNYGMGNKKRVKDGIFFGILYVEIIMFAGIIGLEFFAKPLITLFGLTGETSALCVLATRIIAAGFLFAGMNIAGQAIFQALNAGISSLIVSILRLCIIVLPLAWIFTKFSNAEFMIWFAFPIAEGVAMIAAVILLVKVIQSVMKELD
jgi:putative MATE family efflux protein